MSDSRAQSQFTRRITVFGPAAIVVLTGMLAYVALGRVLETRRWVQHTQDVLKASSSLMTAILDAETAQRGYVLTHDSTFLGSYRGAPPRAEASLAQLRTLVADNSVQVRRLDTLSGQVARRLRMMDSAVNVEREGRTVIVRGVVSFRPGPSLMNDIRGLIDRIDAEENRLLVLRRDAETRSITIAAVVIVLGTLLAGLLAFIVNQNFDRALRERRAALAEMESSNERLQEQAVELETQSLELEQQAEVAQSAAVEAEQATEHAREALNLAEESERRAERLQAATEAFTSALSIGDVGNLIVDESMHALEAHSGALAILEPDRKSLCFVAVRNITPVDAGSRVSIDEDLPICVAVRDGRTVILENPAEIERQFPALIARQRPDTVHALAVYPLRVNNEVTGAIVLRFDRAHRLNAADQSFMGAMSRIATESFERARLFDAEREARAAAESANRAKASFLASMSHELRTPLQAALGFAQLVRSGVYGEINEQQAEVLGRVERSQTHLSRLIDDILDFARLEAGRVRIEASPVALAEVISDLAPLVEPNAIAKKIELSLLPPPDSLRVLADRQRLQQILVNLVGNAIKFTPEAGTIRVGAMADGMAAVISIRDTGVGIPADRIEAIFEPFVQVDEGLTRTTTGTGLGLAISRDLARAMGGDLTVESTLGEGSTFSVILPLAT